MALRLRPRQLLARLVLRPLLGLLGLRRGLLSLKDATEKMLKAASDKTDAEGWHPESREQMR